MGGSEIYTRKREAKKVVRPAGRRGSHNQRKGQIFTNGHDKTSSFQRDTHR